MSCKCLKNQNKDGYMVSPYDYCPFCAEKHLSMVYGEFLQGKNRQLMIGELKCAQMHLNGKDFINEKIDIILENRFEGTDREDIEQLISFNDDIISSELSNNQQKSSDKKFSRNGMVSNDQDLKKSEIAFCVSWRLAEECGYISINRNLIIEKLTIAQIHCYIVNYELAKKLRDIRHLIQYRKENEIGNTWIEIASIYEEINA